MKGGSNYTNSLFYLVNTLVIGFFTKYLLFKLQVKYLISNKDPIPPKKISVSTFVCGSNRNNITSISLWLLG